MPIIKCKMCGCTLDILNSSKVIKCEYCGTNQTVPSFDNEKKEVLFRRANALRYRNEFDKAFVVYESIIEEFPSEAEAYWGLILCKYGIEYVDDPATGIKVPTCHRTQFASIFDDEDYKNAIKNSDVVACEIYKNEASEIDKLQKDILLISSKEEPYDIFICYKESNNGQRTKDSVIAENIFNELTNKGFRVFFSKISLENKLGSAYEPFIFAALQSAKIMIHVTTSCEFTESVWVKNEWSRFLSLISSGQKKTLIPVYCDIDIYELPEEISHLQGLEISKIGAMQDLARGVEKILGNKERKIDNHYSNNGSTLNYDVLLRKAKTYLQSKKYQQASHCFDLAVDLTELCGEAYLGKLLCEFEMSTIDELKMTDNTDIFKSENFELAKDFSTKELAVSIEEIENCIKYNKNVKRYESACQLLNGIDILKLKSAAQEFEDLGDLLDSKEKVKEAKYKMASLYALYNSSFDNIKDLSIAISLFEGLGDYKDSIKRIEKIKKDIDYLINLYIRSFIKKISFDLSLPCTSTTMERAISKYCANKIIFSKEPHQNVVGEEYTKIQNDIKAFVLKNSYDIIAKSKSIDECKKIINYLDQINEKDKTEETINFGYAKIAYLKKKNSICASIIIPSVIVLIGSIITCSIVIPKEIDYKEAISTLENGDFLDASNKFLALNNYKDSRTKEYVCIQMDRMSMAIRNNSLSAAQTLTKNIINAGEKVEVIYRSLSAPFIINGKEEFIYKEIFKKGDCSFMNPVCSDSYYSFYSWSPSKTYYSKNMAHLELSVTWYHKNN